MRASGTIATRSTVLDLVLLAGVALGGFVLVATSWWFQDDWHFLANALGITPRGAGLARFVSYEVYWRLFIGLFGSSSLGWVITRLVIHLVNALLVRTIAARLTGQPATGFAVGLLFAASPLAFECLYWASGVVDLLGTMFALLTFLFWWRGERRIGPAAVVTAVVAIFCKETVLAVIALMAWHVARSRRSTGRDQAALIVILGAAAAALAGLQQDMARSGDYSLAVSLIPRNLAVYGYWLIVPPPLMKSVAIHSVSTVGTGTGLWICWAALGYVLHRRGNPVPAQAGGIALLVLLPAMLVGDHAVPRYAYAAAPAFLLAVVSACGGLSGTTTSQKVVAACLAGVFAWTATAYQVDARWPGGRPLHRYVAKREISVAALRTVGRQLPPGTRQVALVVAPRADRDEVALLQDAIADDLGIRVMFGADIVVRWVSRAEEADLGAVPFLVEGMSLRPLGRGEP